MTGTLLSVVAGAALSLLSPDSHAETAVYGNPADDVAITLRTAPHRSALRAEGRADEDVDAMVTIYVDYDEELYEPGDLCYAYRHGYADWGMWDYGFWDEELKEYDLYSMVVGKFNILLPFTRKSDRMPVLVYLEDVDISEEYVELNASVADANQCISFVPRDPDGKLLSSDIMTVENGEATGVYQDGYLTVGDQIFICRSKMFGTLMQYTLLRNSYWYENGELHYNGVDHVYITPNSDVYFITSFGGVNHEASLNCLMVSDGSATQELTNDPANYRSFDVAFGTLPFQPETPEGGKPFQKGAFCVNAYDITLDGESIMNRRKTVAAGGRYAQKKIIACLPPVENRYGVNILPFPAAYEGVEQVGYVEGQPLDIDKGQFLATMQNSTRFLYNDQGVSNFNFCSNPAMEIPTEVVPVWGAGFPTVPIWRSIAGSSKGDICWNAVGQNGELRVVDQALLSVNGETGMPTSLPVENGSPFNISIEDTNYTIGEMTGSSISTLSFMVKDENSVPPTVQNFRVVDAQGQIAIDMDKAEGVKAEIYAGSFLGSTAENDIRYYSLAETAPVLTLEYAVHGSDEWTPLTVTADETKDFMPGWGRFYSADLSSIKENAYIDLRLTATDADDNKFTQTVSPAFRVKDDSGVDSALEDGQEVIEVIYHDLQGRLVTAPEAGIYIVTETLADGQHRTSKRVVR